MCLVSVLPSSFSSTFIQVCALASFVFDTLMIDSVHVWCQICFLLYPSPLPHMAATMGRYWKKRKLRRQNKKRKVFFFNNINHKPLKRLPFIQTPLSAWGHWEQGNHSSSRSSSDLRKPTWLSHRLGIYSVWKVSLRNVQQERASCSALWNLCPTWSFLRCG